MYVGGFTPVDVEMIQVEMEEFIEWINSESALRIHPVELAALAHYKFVYIHPFIDGNGRTARLLMNLILMQAGFPPVIIRVEDRLEYYETLSAANEGDLRPFIRFIAAATDRTLDGYLGILKNNSGKFSLGRTDCILEGISGQKFEVSKACIREQDSEEKIRLTPEGVAVEPGQEPGQS